MTHVWVLWSKAAGACLALAACTPRDGVEGDPCPKKLRHQFKVPYGRGLCVVKGDEVKGYACFVPWQGIALNVMNFRSSGACQSKPWLPWVIAFVVLALIAGCCGILYVQRRNRSTRRTDVMRDQEDDSYTGDHDEEDGEQEMPPFEDQPGYGRQDMYGGQPSYQQDLDAQYGMPGRASGSSQVPPMSGQFPPTAYMPDQLGTTGASVKIAGLDEPHLPMPSVGFQIPSNTAMSNVSTSGQYAMGLPLLTTPGSPQQAYTTQLPYGSPGSRAFATTLPATYTAAPAPTSGGSVRLTAPAVTVPQPYTTTYTTPQG
ncbi:Potassium voltage-gated channel subfamily H member 2 [Durusdinium trenchii]|uniref:Potassium voltage-gated channel subfamily H member 2 n=1 Tax=Durusdinium trenchii TaxID=1381693 RepID=A0ABP0IPQ0_9DINO